MKYFLDTEFVEDGKTIMPISLALVCEDESELYIELEFDEVKAQAHDFVREHVLPHLRLETRVSKERARELILEFIGDDDDPEFWAYFADYDWVLFCQLFGTMIGLPPHFPKFCMDLQQLRVMRRVRSKPKKPENEHDALADARWNLLYYRDLMAAPDPAVVETRGEIAAWLEHMASTSAYDVLRNQTEPPRGTKPRDVLEFLAFRVFRGDYVGRAPPSLVKFHTDQARAFVPTTPENTDESMALRPKSDGTPLEPNNRFLALLDGFHSASRLPALSAWVERTYSEAVQVYGPGERAEIAALAYVLAAELSVVETDQRFDRGLYTKGLPDRLRILARPPTSYVRCESCGSRDTRPDTPLLRKLWGCVDCGGTQVEVHPGQVRHER